jgi:hypothetical protein
MEKDTLSASQVHVIRTLFELAQGRIDVLYSEEGAEEEKRAIEEWITRVFPNDCDSIVRAVN